MRFEHYRKMFIWSMIVIFLVIISSIYWIVSDVFRSIPYGEFWVFPLIAISIYLIFLSFSPKFKCSLMKSDNMKITFQANDNPPIRINYPFNWNFYLLKSKMKGVPVRRLFIVIDDGEQCIFLSEYLKLQDSVPKTAIPINDINVMSEHYYEYIQAFWPLNLKKLGRILEKLDKEYSKMNYG